MWQGLFHVWRKQHFVGLAAVGAFHGHVQVVINDQLDIMSPVQDQYLIEGGSGTFVIKYDTYTRNPKWVLEHISNRDGTVQDSRKHMHFFPESKISFQAFQTRPDDFKNSGYDRGHIAPSANHKSSVEDMKSTFTMANVSPQDPGFNRGYWLKLEEWIRSLLKPETQSELIDVFIVSGPAFLPSMVNGEWISMNRVIGQFPRWVQVPTHFFKVVLRVSQKRANLAIPPNNSNNTILEQCNIEFAAFLVPNRNIDTKIPVEAFCIKLTDLEAAVGMCFFSKLISDETKLKIDNLSTSSIFPGRNSFEIEVSHGMLNGTGVNGGLVYPISSLLGSAQGAQNDKSMLQENSCDKPQSKSMIIYSAYEDKKAAEDGERSSMTFTRGKLMNNRTEEEFFITLDRANFLSVLLGKGKDETHNYDAQCGKDGRPESGSTTLWYDGKKGDAQKLIAQFRHLCQSGACSK